MNAFQLELRPRNVLDLIDASVRLYRRHFGTLLGISALVLVPFGIAHTVGQFYYAVAVQPMMTQGPQAGFQVEFPALITALVAVCVALLIVTILGPLSQGALALAISEHYLGRTIGVFDAYRRVLTYWWSLFVVGFVFGLLVSVGPVAGGVLGAAIGIPVGLYAAPEAGTIAAVLGMLAGGLAGLPVSALFFTWFVFYEQTMVLENRRGLDSLQRSRELVTGRGWHVFGTLLLTGLAISVATVILSLPAQIAVGIVSVVRPDLFLHFSLFSECLQEIISVLLGPVFMIVQTLVYYDLRIRREGFDLQMMAAAVEGLRERKPQPVAQPPAGPETPPPDSERPE